MFTPYKLLMMYHMSSGAEHPRQNNAMLSNYPLQYIYCSLERIDGRQQLNQLILIIPFYTILLASVGMVRWRLITDGYFHIVFIRHLVLEDKRMVCYWVHRFSSLDRVPSR